MHNQFQDEPEEESSKEENNEANDEGHSGPQLMAKIREMVTDQPKQNEAEEGVNGKAQEEKKEAPKENEVNDDNKENQEEEEEYQLGKKRAQRKMQKKTQENEDRKNAEKKINGYYKKSYMGNCISGIMYVLCQQLNKESNKVGVNNRCFGCGFWDWRITSSKDTWTRKNTKNRPKSCTKKFLG